jgi:hypothetical protein
MKTSKIYLGLAVALIAGAITFTSCRKKQTTAATSADTEQSTATDNNLAENTSNDIVSMGSQVCESGALSTFKTSETEVLTLAPCATITPNASTKTYTVDFGTTGCVGTDGRTRTGKLIYNYSATSPTTSIHYRNPGFNVSVTSSNYVVDGNQINIINKTIKNTTPNSIPTGPNPGTNLTWAITANISIVKANAETVSWSCSRTKELTNTSNTACYGGQTVAIDWTKAIVKLNGTASGTNAKGESFTATATNLVRDFNCAPDPNHIHRHPFISGTISYTPGSRPARLIDYGNGTCDLVGTITINGQTYSFNM